MQQSLILSTTPEDRQKARLQKSLHAKQKTLASWMEKVESLRIALDLIKNEYDVRIGALLLKDNQLDLEIIKYKNLKRLLEEGMTYEEALRYEEDKFYNEILRMQKEQERIHEEEVLLGQRVEVAEDVQESIKILWKNLIRKFHPDLIADPEEKRQREGIMKQINNAYAANNLEALKEFENTAELAKPEVMGIERLEQVLVDTENMILRWQEKFKELRISEWYMWMKRKGKVQIFSEDVFVHLERKLLDDIVRKIEILNELKEDVIPQGVENNSSA